MLEAARVERVSFIRTANTQSANLNIRDFTNYLADSKQWLSKTKYVSSVEFGTEVSEAQDKLIFPIGT
ncbi:hypothetical protein PO124_19755 [Bacillus licheniformis]|nr:hypothetical protein [Bacillus licheniformis]